MKDEESAVARLLPRNATVAKLKIVKSYQHHSHDVVNNDGQRGHFELASVKSVSRTHGVQNNMALIV